MCAAFRRPIRGPEEPGREAPAWQGAADPAPRDEPGKNGASFTFGSWKDLPLAESIAAPKRPPAANVPLPERAIALGGIIVLAPVMLAVAAAIKITSPGGPVVYSQERVGLDRRRNRAPGGSFQDGTERRKNRGYAA